MKTLGETIKAARERKRISVIKLAEALEVTRPAIYAWQDDKYAPSLTHLIELSKILDVPLTVFAAAVQGVESVDAELMMLPPSHAEFLSRSFLDQIGNLKKLQNS